MTDSDSVTAAIEAAKSSQLTWEGINKVSWIQYVKSNSSNGEFDTTATYQNEMEWESDHIKSYTDAYDNSYENS